MKNVNLKVNGVSVTVPEGTRILDAAVKAGFKVPTLCYMKDLCNESSCRICVVEIKNNRGLFDGCRRGHGSVYKHAQGKSVA